MILPIRTFDQLVQDMASAINASTSSLFDLSVGTILRAIIEANAAMVQWAQWLAILALGTARAATSAGPDLDSWMADFSLVRLPPTYASGFVTLSRYSTFTQALIPVGSSVRTQDGKISFAIVSDPTISSWNSQENSYILPSGISSIDLPILALSPGSSSNVAPGTVTLLASPIPGIDTVINADTVSGGTDAETDASFRSRFSLYFNSRSRATVDAIAYAITQTDPTLTSLILENTAQDGTSSIGSVLIIIDKYGCQLSDIQLQEISTAVEYVRPIGTFFSVQSATAVSAVFAMKLTLAQNATVAAVESEIEAAISAYVQSLPIGGSISFTRVAQVCFNASDFVVNVTNLSVNGQSTDVSLPSTQVFFYNGITFS